MVAMRVTINALHAGQKLSIQRLILMPDDELGKYYRAYVLAKVFKVN